MRYRTSALLHTLDRWSGKTLPWAFAWVALIYALHQAIGFGYTAFSTRTVGPGLHWYAAATAIATLAHQGYRRANPTLMVTAGLGVGAVLLTHHADAVAPWWERHTHGAVPLGSTALIAAATVVAAVWLSQKRVLA